MYSAVTYSATLADLAQSTPLRPLMAGKEYEVKNSYGHTVPVHDCAHPAPTGSDCDNSQSGYFRNIRRTRVPIELAFPTCRMESDDDEA